MASIFTLENIEDFSEKLNIDELYEKKRQYDLSKLALYNKILNRIHVRIKTTSRQKVDEQFCWFVVPELIIGVPKYDQALCIAYLMDKLKENGFNIRYIHPNALFISWLHWVPSYVRTELKKKTGIVIDEYGQKVEGENDDNNNGFGLGQGRNTSRLKLEDRNPNDLMFNVKNQGSQQQNQDNVKQKKNYTPITSYKPSGNFVYNDDLLNKIEDKFL
uniref:Uncharacterized protein n=1 Tax=viral metagenome TaxID=1070528 RepID=A0A6C0JIG7_9ZZZZ